MISKFGVLNVKRYKMDVLIEKGVFY